MAVETPLRLLIAEAHETLRTALNIFFSERDVVEVVGQASNTEQALSLCEALQPDVLLINSEMNAIPILLMIGRLCKASPDTRIVVLTSNLNDIPFEKFLAAGASTVVEEGIFASNLFAVIQQVYRQA
jgi:DNA-binding NarL/FixJ family response regulator